MQLNKTVGGNADRIKFTGMLQSKSNAYTQEPKDKKPFVKKQSLGISNLIETINGLSNSMADNHSRMEGIGNRGNAMGNGMGGGIGSSNGGSFYKWKPEGNPV